MLEDAPKVRIQWWVVCSTLFVAGLIVLSCEQPQQSHRSYPRRQDATPSERQAEPILIRVRLMQTDRVQVRCSHGGLAVINAVSHKPVRALSGRNDVMIRRQQGHWIVLDQANQANHPDVKLTTDALTLSSLGEAILTIGAPPGRAYRGQLRLSAVSDQRFSVVNQVELEDYLGGVIGSEMPASWDLAALQTQAIASRTYVLYEMHSYRGQRSWDVTNDQRSQVYSGIAKEHRRVDRALRDTRGIVLTFGPFGNEKIFPSFFSSTCGGHTQDSRALIRESLEPLKGQTCPHCRQSGAKHFAWNPLRIEKTEVSRLLIQEYSRLESLERIVGIEILEQSPYGRIEKIQLIGSNGKAAKLKAELFRLAVSTRKKPLRSSWYELVDAGSHWQFANGRGWGHGVGLCQYGCYQMARDGKKCTDILSFYYPGSQLVRAY